MNGQDYSVKERPVARKSVFDPCSNDEQGGNELKAVDDGLQVVDDVVEGLQRFVPV